MTAKFIKTQTKPDRCLVVNVCWLQSRTRQLKCRSVGQPKSSTHTQQSLPCICPVICPMYLSSYLSKVSLQCIYTISTTLQDKVYEGWDGDTQCLNPLHPRFLTAPRFEQIQLWGIHWFYPLDIESVHPTLPLTNSSSDCCYMHTTIFKLKAPLFRFYNNWKAE